ncbi:MAG: hypothetical protein GQ470_02720 [Gammaproteobacteria bacterium]|nr:hypothetical protein [Gammaproteobacteria bacterium]
MVHRTLLQICLFLLSLTALSMHPAHAAGPDELISTGLVNPGFVEKPTWFK